MAHVESAWVCLGATSRYHGTMLGALVRCCAVAVPIVIVLFETGCSSCASDDTGSQSPTSMDAAAESASPSSDASDASDGPTIVDASPPPDVALDAVESV